MVRRAEEKVLKSSGRAESTAVITVTPNPSSRKRAKSRKTSSQVRRSERLQSNAVMPTEKGEIERVIDEITLSESEKEEEEEDEQPTQEEDELPETMGANNIEEKVEYILRRLEAQQETIDKLKSMVTNGSSQGDTDNPAAIDARYKSLYIKSQRKIEALADENKQLVVSLEIANSKLEAYEKGTNVFFDVLRKAKDMIIVPDAARGAETTVNVPFQPLDNLIDSAENAGNEGRASCPKKAKLG